MLILTMFCRYPHKVNKLNVTKCGFSIEVRVNNLLKLKPIIAGTPHDRYQKK